jgi:biotin-dependent carboxylase-like uncharacterized protein
VGIHVLRGGLLTTVQDLGRWGFQHLGVPVAGPMDVVSHRLANAWVGNRQEAATLEITLVGPELEFSEDGRFVVAGAEFDLFLDGSSVGTNRVINVSSGQRLRFGSRSRGARAYLSIEGGIDVPVFLGSRATHIASRMGGVEGRRLRDGDFVSIGLVEKNCTKKCSDSVHGRNLISSGVTRVRVLLAADRGGFDLGTVERFFSGRYIVSVQSDRMAFRLHGAPLSIVDRSEMLSEATSQGAIQVPRDGMPIVLMADRQTIGGYPVLGNVISADLPGLGQLAPGDRVRFEACDEETALRAVIAQERLLLSQESDRR